MIRKSLLATAIVAVTGFGVSAYADFNAGFDAYERQDYRTAYQEFSQDAERDDPDAQYMLGRMYARGLSVPQDFVQAYRWYNLAAAAGHRHAPDARDRLAERMTSQQIAQAQRMSSRQQGNQTGSDGNRFDDRSLDDRQLLAAIQRQLNSLGYDAGPDDGLMGSQTRSAIRDYQISAGLDPDGQPSRRLLRHMTDNPAVAADDNDDQYDDDQDQDRRWGRRVLRETFRDGDYTNDPQWNVVSGSFKVTAGEGLRTVQRPARLPFSNNRQSRPDDLPAAILGAIFEQAMQSQSGDRRPEQDNVAEIHTPVSFSNAFAIRVTLSAREAEGGIGFGPYLGRYRSGGYRLFYAPESRRFHLLRMTSQGSNVIERSEPLNLSANRDYDLRWTRDDNGEMTVRLDGQTLFRVTDRSFSDPFDGFTIVNRGGDYSFRRVIIRSR